jgi:glycosyltransferase involved in cell wall biosynthesis
MRILFCNYEYPPLGGGGGVINGLLAQELAKRHDVTVLTSRALGLPAESIENGVKIVRTPVFYRRHEAVASLSSMLTFVLSGLRTGKKLLSREGYDVINTHFVLPSGPVGDGLARFAGIPNVLTLHGGDLYDPSKIFSPHQHLCLRMWVRFLLRRSDIVIGQSKNTLDNMRRYYTPEIEGLQVPLGIRRHPVPPASRSSYGFSENAILLITVGRLIARKQVRHLLKVLHLLRDEPLHLLVVGSGPQESALKKIASNLSLQDRVHFLGQVEETEKFGLLRMADVYISASQHEGFGLVFLEAMSAGLPIVCYDHGGQTDFLANGLTGYLLPLDDLNALAASCRTLVRDRALRDRMGRENLSRVEELYVERCAERYEEIFQEAIKRCGLQRVVNLSSTKKLPLDLADAKLFEAGITPGIGALTSMVDGKKQSEALGSSGESLAKV